MGGGFTWVGGCLNSPQILHRRPQPSSFALSFACSLQLELRNDSLAVVLVHPQVPLNALRLHPRQIHLLDLAHLQRELQVLVRVPALEHVTLLFVLQPKLLRVVLFEVQHAYDFLDDYRGRRGRRRVDAEDALDLLDLVAGAEEGLEGGLDVGEDDRLALGGVVEGGLGGGRG